MKGTMQKYVEKHIKTWVNEPKFIQKVIDAGGDVHASNDLLTIEDTNTFYTWFESEIWEQLNADADANGHPNAMAFIATFSNAKNIVSLETLARYLSWYAFYRTVCKIAEK